ncbi:MAG: histidine kinase [Bacteroidota bacterium]
MKVRFKTLFLSVLIHPFTWALPVTFLIILALPPIFERYTIQKKSTRKLLKSDTYQFIDLNADGISEEINPGNNDIGARVYINNRNGRAGQWNMPGKFRDQNLQFMDGDYNSDGYKEIYVFTQKGDSILLTGIDFEKQDSSRFMFLSRLICRLDHRNNKFDNFIKKGKVTDLDGDGYCEVVFIVMAGFSLQPRAVFAYNIIKDTVIRSPFSGILGWAADFGDIDGDGLDEIALSNNGSANCDSTYPLSDFYHYVAVLDNDLKFLFRPIPFSGDFGQTFARINKNEKSIIALEKVESNRNNVPMLMKLDRNGNMLKSIKFPKDFNRYNIRLEMIKKKDQKEAPLIYKEFSTIKLLDTSFNVETESDETVGEGPISVLDVDNDGNDEIICSTPEVNKYMILRGNLKDPVFYNMPFEEGNLTISVKKNGPDHDPELIVQSRMNAVFFLYKYNKYYILKYPAYLLQYVIIASLFFILRGIQKRQAMKKYETEKRIARLQFLTIRNQFDPHFTFNALNMIGGGILKGKREDAYQMLLKFSKMLRATVISAELVSWSLREELEFCKNYLEIQQLRFGEGLMYKTEIADDVDLSLEIPKMVIQTYVENAIKHGLAPRQGNGEIRINAMLESETLVLKVTDNGVGRKQAKESSFQSTGKGRYIMKQYFELFNKVNKTKMTDLIIDLYDDQGEAAGTEVMVTIPLNFNYSLVKPDEAGNG